MLPDIVEIGQQLLLKHDKCPSRLCWVDWTSSIAILLFGERVSSSTKDLKISLGAKKQVIYFKEK